MDSRGPRPVNSTSFSQLLQRRVRRLRDRILATGEASALREAPIHPSESAPQMYLGHESAGEACLTVRDEGAGLPADFEARRAASLGFRIIDGLTRQIGGRFEARRPRRGAEFALYFRAD